MKILKAQASNFGSYRNLNMNFDYKGTALIYGATGSGKSTIQDLIPWVLYGTTAKNGNADDIRNWKYPDDVTRGYISIQLKDGTVLEVIRVRGKSNQNDLYWVENEGDPARGKDLTDTQKLLESRLGVSKEAYITGAYYNEFSPIGSFFTAKAKDRRRILESLVDLSFCINLTNLIDQKSKKLKKQIVDVSNCMNFSKGSIDQLYKTLGEAQQSNKKWLEDQKDRKAKHEAKIAAWEENKNMKLMELDRLSETWESSMNTQLADKAKAFTTVDAEVSQSAPVCDKCGSPSKDHLQKQVLRDKLAGELARLSDMVNPYTTRIEDLKNSVCPYTETIEDKIENPYENMIAQAEGGIAKAQQELKDHENQLDRLKKELFSLSQLKDFNDQFRTDKVFTTIKNIENQANEYLERHFDAEIRIKLDPIDTDDLDVEITKGGYLCSYAQLSKGQRCLLKLCFSIAVMEASANKNSTHFGSLFFDEALDGLDNALKLRSYDLFCELEKKHDSIFVIEHNNDLQTLFSKLYYVRLEGDESFIEEK